MLLSWPPTRSAVAFGAFELQWCATPGQDGSLAFPPDGSRLPPIREVARALQDRPVRVRLTGSICRMPGQVTGRGGPRCRLRPEVLVDLADRHRSLADR